MDRRFKPLTPSEDTAIRVALYEELAANPLPPGKAVALIQKRLRLTTPELAKVAKVSERSLRDLKSDRGNPSLRTMEKVLAPFRLTLSVTHPVREVE